jgi:hypothetical protein
VSDASGEALFRRLLSSTIKGDLLVLFRRNPGLIDTYDGVARRIGRRADAIRADAHELVEMGVLSTKKVGAADVIYLNRAGDAQVQDTVAKYLGGLKSR